MEQILVLLVLFVLLPLANYMLERMRRRYPPPPHETRRMPDMGLRRQPRPQVVEPATRQRGQEAPRIAVDRPLARHSGPKLFRNKRDLRRVIIAMTILGPCRANQSE